MVSKKESLRETKVLRNFKNLDKKQQSAHLDLLAYTGMVKGLLEQTEKWINEKKLPTFKDIKKHNLIYGTENSQYLN